MTGAAPRRLAAVLAPLLACGPSGCAPPVDLTAPNVVLITIDTLRADHLGCYGYFRDTSPEIDSFARESLLFERCLTPIATTFPSHVSLLTGTFPGAHGIAGNMGDGGVPFEPTDRLRSLAQILSGHGYATAAFVSATPIKKYTGINAGFDSFNAPGRGQRNAAATNEAVLPWLEEKTTEPYFLWVHYFDPHSPYDPPPEFQGLFESDRELVRRLDARDVEKTKKYPDSPRLTVVQAVNLYDGEIRFADQQVGRLLDRLREDRAAWNRTVVVIVGDHGEGLGQHDDMTHGGIWKEQLRVPLLIRVPGTHGRRVPGLTSTVDVLPTLLGLVDLPGEDEILAQAGGVDRLAADRSDRPLASQESASGYRTRGGERDPEHALVTVRWKLVLDPQGEDRLFDLAKDPFELRAVEHEYPDTVRTLRRRLFRELARQESRREFFYADAESSGADSSAVEVDPEILQQLRALGYAD